MQRIHSSRSAAFAVLLAGSSILVSCSSEKVETSLVKDTASCPTIVEGMKSPTGSALMGEEKNDAIRKCEADYKTALAEHVKNAPAFAKREDCESEFTNCEPTSAAHSTGSSNFMPLMAGYMLGSMMSNSRSYAPQAAYAPRSGGYVNNGGASLGRSFGKVSFGGGAEALKTTPTRTTTLKRGGFGEKATSMTSSSRPSVTPRPSASIRPTVSNRSPMRSPSRGFSGRSFSS